MKTVLALTLLLACSFAVAVPRVQIDVCNVATGSVKQLTLPATGLGLDRGPGFSPMPPGPKVLANPALLARARQLFRSRNHNIDKPLPLGTKGALPPAKLGTYHAIVLLVDFSDHPAQFYPGTQAAAHYDEMLFSVGKYPTGSMRDWYRENSYAKFEVDGRASGGPTGWHRAPQTYEYYVNDNYGESAYPRNAQKLVEDVVKVANPYVDFSRYDNDGDGFVDSLFVCHSGAGAEATGATTDIWSHMWQVQNPVTVDGVTVSPYSIEPENGTIGVFCHEYGHILGAYDLYDYGNNYAGYDSCGVGVWSVMAGGSWGADYNSEERPSHFDPYHKILFGWIDPVVPKAGETGVSLPAVQGSPTVYKLWKKGWEGKEYFLVENRQKRGFDARLLGAGLLIWHVEESRFEYSYNDAEWFPGMDPKDHYGVAVEQADARWDLEHNFNVGDAGDPFPGTAGNRAFTFGTTPGSNSYVNGPSGVQITGISDSGPTMTFDLAVTMPAQVQWYVKSEASGNGTGTSPASSFNTIAQALLTAKSGDTIHVAPGVYNENLDFGGKNLTVVADWPQPQTADTPTIIRGTTSGPTVRFVGGETRKAVLRGFTITHATNVPGSGIVVNGASPTLEDNHISDNVSDRGGSLLNYGGGINIRGKSNPLIEGCQVLRNAADRGAGISVYESGATILNCVLQGNRANYDGGGVYVMNSWAKVSLRNCRFIGEEARRGGGLFCDSSSPTVLRCRFESCAARNHGGAIQLRNSSSPRIVNTEILNCCAFLYDTSAGGGLYAYSRCNPLLDRLTLYGCSAPVGAALTFYGGCAPTLKNSILSGSAGPGITVDKAIDIRYCNLWHNGKVNVMGMDDPVGQNGNLSRAPRYADAAAGDLHLKSTEGHWTATGWVKDYSSSPCIDAGDPTTPVGNEPQPNGGRVNMGADGGTVEASLSAPLLPAVTVAQVTAAAATTGNGGAQITVNLSSAAQVSVIVSNLAGRPVAVLGEKALPQGVSTLLWDGRSHTGTQVPAGRYLVRVQARTATGTMGSCLVGLVR